MIGWQIPAEEHPVWVAREAAVLAGERLALERSTQHDRLRPATLEEVVLGYLASGRAQPDRERAA